MGDLPMAVTTSRVIRASKTIDRASFAPFGEVIERPSSPAKNSAVRQLRSVKANQGTATKYLDVTYLDNHYATHASSGKQGNSVVNMFDCEPRDLQAHSGTVGKVFPVEILERHPYTSQTFIPLGIAAGDAETKYLVIVAPTLLPTKIETVPKPYPTPPTPRRRRSLKERLMGARPNPFTNDHAPRTTPASTLEPERRPKGPGMPDLERLQAFIVKGDQAVTYGPGTWHAPMVVLGSKSIPFVVVQYANGVGEEDCQECLVRSEGGGEGVVVDVDGGDGGDEDSSASGAGIMRAKL
ncbi:related to ureidoglycolate hydrolase [Ramularia collo-cygni]|uniref:Related to ureidoglycolate hydrolase n=1 Tax=Ramularia collo-cygni TaxID=112498 RepID=A0A2D3VCL6_9PEZI|nr:related to ureidoglycolate hydrolase [Ramularia collo-cygni]CZT23455.1 related to ureidoglycolate hydrolase [Ramularia collo-cygni]